MCNLYSFYPTGSLIDSDLAEQVINERIGNLGPQPGIFPDMQAPVIANVEGLPSLTKMRWGMPSPAFALKGKNYDKGITNVRNTKSGHWRRWFAPEHRCIVPFSSFSEPGPDKKPVWFAMSEDRPLMYFAGIWTNHTSVRKVKDGESNDDLFAFLTTDPNDVVTEIHPKAMPVILTDENACKLWLTAPMEDALTLQKPLPDGVLEIVARGARQDGPDAQEEAQGSLF